MLSWNVSSSYRLKQLDDDRLDQGNPGLCLRLDLHLGLDIGLPLALEKFQRMIRVQEVMGSSSISFFLYLFG
jgi:hypothetical protein